VNDGGDRPPAAGGRHRRLPPVLSWRARLERTQRHILRQPVALSIMDVVRAYDRGGGGMLAGALAYYAFFTMVPALLLFVSLLGVLVEDQVLRDELVASFVDRIDHIREVATVVIDGLADSGRTGTVVALLGLVWGASGFYGALQSAMARMFPGQRSRDFLRTRIRGLLTVVLILGSMLTAVLFVIALPLARSWLTARCVELDGLHLVLLEQACGIDPGIVSGAAAVAASMLVAGLAALIVYVVIPPDGASLRQASWPALLAGVAIGLFTSLFGWIAPLVMRQWLALGIVGNVFLALIWFNLVFQALIYGAALARLRRDRERSRTGRPSL
jgi:membrane protein